MYCVLYCLVNNDGAFWGTLAPLERLCVLAHYWRTARQSESIRLIKLVESIRLIKLVEGFLKTYRRSELEWHIVQRRREREREREKKIKERVERHSGLVDPSSCPRITWRFLGFSGLGMYGHRATDAAGWAVAEVLRHVRGSKWSRRWSNPCLDVVYVCIDSQMLSMCLLTHRCCLCVYWLTDVVYVCIDSQMLSMCVLTHRCCLCMHWLTDVVYVFTDSQV